MLCYADSHQTSSRSRQQVPAVAHQFPRPDRIMDETTEDISTLPPPPLWRHCMAMLYDTLLVIPLFMAAAGVWVAVLGPTESISEPAVPAYLQWCSWLVILIAFFGVFWRRAGQTLGMQAWRIKLITDSGEPLSWRSVISSGCRRIYCRLAFCGGLPLAIRQATPPLLARFPVANSLGLPTQKGRLGAPFRPPPRYALRHNNQRPPIQHTLIGTTAATRGS